MEIKPISLELSDNTKEFIEMIEVVNEALKQTAMEISRIPAEFHFRYDDKLTHI